MDAAERVGWRGIGAALGLALAGVTAPIAVAAIAARSDLLGPPLVASALVGLLVLAPAGVGLATALSGLRRVAAGLAAQGSGEAEQAVLRVFVATLVFGYSLGLAAATVSSGQSGADLPGVPPATYLPVAAFGLVAAWAVLLHVILWPAAAPVRRYGATALDLAVISALLHFGGGEVAGWYPLYLLVIFDAGLRFGLGALLGTAIGSILGFAGVILSTEIWRQQPVLGAGLLLALAVLPAMLAGTIRAIASARAGTADAAAEGRRTLLLIADNLRLLPPQLVSTGSAVPGADERGLIAPWVRVLASRIEHVADFAALEGGLFAVPFEAFDLRAMVNRSLAPLRATAAAEGTMLRWRVDPHLPSRLRGRAAAFARVLGGLAEHAIEVAPAGTVRIALDAISRDTHRLRLRLMVDIAGIGHGSISASAESAFALRLVQRLVALLGGEFATDRISGERTRLAATLALGVQEGATGPILDLGNRTVLIATEDEEFVGELAVLLDQWNADARWVGDADGALAELTRHDTPEPSALTPVLVIDGRGKLLSALSLAHQAAQIGGDAPFILLAADAGQIESLGEVDQGEIDGFLPLPVSEALLANAFHGMPLGPPGPDPLTVRRPVDPPRATAKRQAGLGEPNEQATNQITPIAAHPKFVPDMAATLDMRAIEGLRALDGSPGFLEEVIATFRADARQIMERVDREVAAADAAGFAHCLSALRRAASPLGATQLCELLASLHGLTASELRQQGALHVQRLDAEIERLAATLTEFLPAGEARLR